MSMQYDVTVTISCDDKGCAHACSYVAEYERSNADAVYKKANEFFYLMGWVVFKRKNYCASCAVKLKR